MNIIIDPFGFWDLVSIRGINSQRPEVAASARMAKAEIVCRMQPDTVIMGTSRAEVGLDPHHPGWGKFPGKTYNLALAGSGLKELELTLRHAVYASPHLRHVVMALDFLMFNANREAVVFGTEVLDFDPNSLLSSPSDSCLRVFFHNADKLAWIGGIRFAIATVLDQMPDVQRLDPAKSQVTKWLALYDRSGFRGNNFDVLLPLAQKNGFRSLIDSVNGENAGQEAYYASKIWRAGPDQRYCFTRPGQPDTIAVFRNIVAFARKSGIDIRFVINPIHARMLVAIEEIGLWPQYEAWKRDLVSVLAQDARQNHAKPFPLWDFSGFNTVTTEPIPPPGDNRTMMRWWWEPSHYQKAAGDLMLDRALDYRPGLASVPSDFGILLTPANIDAWLAETRERGREYRRDQPKEVKIVSNRVLPLIADADGTNCGYDIDALREASASLRRGDHATAEADFAHAVAIHEADEQQAAALGVPDREVGFPKLLREARAGKEIPVSLANWQAYQTRADERAAKSDFAGAIGDYTRAIRFGPANSTLYLLRGTARLRLADSASAIQDFEAGLKLEPTNPTLQALRRQAEATLAVKLQQEADAARSNRDVTAAIRLYGEAIGVSPPSTELYYLRGTARLDTGDFTGAAEDFDAGLRLDPDNAALAALRRRAQSALKANAAAPRGTDAVAAVELQHAGDAKRAQGDVAGAIADYSEAIKVGPPNTALYFLRGTARLQAGALTGAAADFEAGLKLDPTNVTLAQLLKTTVIKRLVSSTAE
ncbi:MAG TPA: tetratricopeptide repeat protein [Stellaceae bacterium]|nr:tetratricopeptide repeat protein [Stellaceae bacterium]